MTRSAADVRNEFLEFFRRRGHRIVPGWPVVPYDDPTLLFTNAGMNQFKDVFLATGTRPYSRAADTQPCIRAGGKHNDLDDVGHDTYHHTFFEMLGNWSFGDYFKREAIAWAWELLTDVWGLDKQRLHATYFGGSGSAGVPPAKQGNTGVPPAANLEPDLEARDLWTEVTDINPAHIHPGSVKDNFWEMGETGPCGPCSEIHIDLTPDKGGAKLVNAGDPRVIEIWNLVFIQFNRGPDGKLTPLPAKHVDTGMGFERVCALLQGKSSNYDTDLFTPIFQAIRDVTGAPPYRGTLCHQTRSAGPPSPAQAPSDAGTVGLGRPTLQGRADDAQLMLDTSYRVIADHIRCLTFAMTDGCLPDREGRGYVLRRILRRAVRYGWQYFNVHEPFLYKLVPAVVESLGDAFPQLRGSAGILPAIGRGIQPALGPQRVAEIIREEEESFDRTLDRGIALFEEAAACALGRQMAKESGWRFRKAGPVSVDDRGVPNRWTLWFQKGLRGRDEILMDLSRDRIQSKVKQAPVISGEAAFKLHDTYGFPIDLTEIMAEEKSLRVDIGEYERLMEQAREQARTGVQVVTDELLDSISLDDLDEQLRLPLVDTDDLAKYQSPPQCDAVLGYVVESGKDVVFAADQTCFYAEQGGQIADTGVLMTDTGEVEIQLVKRIERGIILHKGVLRRGQIRQGQTCKIVVDWPRRHCTMQNHTATHVMNWALREVLGDHVQQKGSLVDPDKTRFDFSHPKPLTLDEIERVEQLVNDRIRDNLKVCIADDVPISEKPKLDRAGLRAVFEGSYPERVRVMSIGAPVEDVLANPDNPEWREFPIELCGGTHCKNTGQIEHFAIVSEEAVAKGIRRVVGITGTAAYQAIETGTDLLQRADALRRAGQEVAAGPRTGRSDRLKTGPTSVAAGGSPADQNRDRKGAATAADVPSAEDFAAQVAELQKAADEATVRVVDRVKLRDAIGELQQIIKKQQKEQAAEALDVVNARIDELLRSPTKIGDTTVIVAEMPDVPIDQLKNGADRIKQKCKSAAVLFGVVQEATERPFDPAQGRLRDDATTGSAGVPPAATTGSAGVPPADTAHRAVAHRPKPAGKALLLAAMTPDLIKKGLRAGDLVKHLAPLIDGRGGGPPTMAQAGGKNPKNVAHTLDAGRRWIDERLKG